MLFSPNISFSMVHNIVFGHIQASIDPQPLLKETSRCPLFIGWKADLYSWQYIQSVDSAALLYFLCGSPGFYIKIRFDKIQSAFFSEYFLWQSCLFLVLAYFSSSLYPWMCFDSILVSAHFNSNPKIFNDVICPRISMGFEVRWQRSRTASGVWRNSLDLHTRQFFLWTTSYGVGHKFSHSARLGKSSRIQPPCKISDYRMCLRSSIIVGSSALVILLVRMFYDEVTRNPFMSIWFIFRSFANYFVFNLIEGFIRVLYLFLIATVSKWCRSGSSHFLTSFDLFTACGIKYISSVKWRRCDMLDGVLGFLSLC